MRIVKGLCGRGQARWACKSNGDFNTEDTEFTEIGGSQRAPGQEASEEASFGADRDGNMGNGSMVLADCQLALVFTECLFEREDADSNERGGS